MKSTTDDRIRNEGLTTAALAHADEAERDTTLDETPSNPSNPLPPLRGRQNSDSTYASTDKFADREPMPNDVRREYPTTGVRSAEIIDAEYEADPAGGRDIDTMHESEFERDASIPADQHSFAADRGAARQTTARVQADGFPAAGTAEQAAGANAALLTENEAGDFRSRWDRIQVGFVDQPRESVKMADNLVAETMKRLAEVFADERTKLEHQWDQGDNVSTEDLRVALQRYRAFFGRLLAI